MKNVAIFAVLLLAVCLTAQAGWYNPPRVWGDLSWWGNSGARPDPVRDATRAGYWWYPTQPASNVGDAELWGNRGKIFHTWVPAVVAPPPPVQPPPVTPEIDQERILLDNVLFDFDKAVLKPEGRAEVDKLVAEMRKWPQDTVVIEGHTDSIGSDAYNMALGQRRADAVRSYMVEQGIAPNRITAISKGEREPLVPNDTPANRKLNRRAEFRIQIVNQ
jgi:OmpA-OmpF porin, OOP family